MRYATRLNGFASRPELFGGRAPGTKLSATEQVGRAATVRGLSALDFNYADHLAGPDGRDLVAAPRTSGSR